MDQSGLVGKPVMSDRDILGAALLCPPFGPHPTVWQLTIDKGGLLRQDVFVWNGPVDELRHEEATLPAEEVVSIVTMADRVGFRSFRDRYDGYPVTDQETLWIAVRFPEGLKTVEAYAPIWLAVRENNREMLGFLELWGRIHRWAPFQSKFNQPETLLAAERMLQALVAQG